MNMIDLIFTLKPSASMADTRRKLEASNVYVKSSLRELGMILGRADDKDWQKFRNMPEFASVDRDEAVQIAPPDAPLQ